MSDAKRIVGTLRRIRRRLFFSRLVESSGLACCIFGISAVLFSFERLRFYQSPGLWLGLLSGGLAATVLVYSVLSMPSWKETVKLADRRLDLQQRLETAWECLTPREEIDRIILMDAGRRLTAISPASVVPFRIQRNTGILLTVGLLAFSTLSIARLLAGTDRMKPASFDNPRQIAAETHVEPDAGAEEAPAKNPDAGPRGLPDSESDAVRKAPATSRGTMEDVTDSAVLQASPQPSGGTGMDAADAFDRGMTPSEAFPFGQTPPGMAESDAERAPDTSGDIDAKPEMTAREPDTNRNDEDTPLSSFAGLSDRKEIGNSEGATAGMQHPQPAGDAAGKSPAAGQTMQPPDDNRHSGNEADLRARLTADYPALRIAAEQALSREKIPPGLRKYIDDYFRAIHP